MSTRWRWPPDSAPKRVRGALGEADALQRRARERAVGARAIRRYHGVRA